MRKFNKWLLALFSAYLTFAPTRVHAADFANGLLWAGLRDQSGIAADLKTLNESGDAIYTAFQCPEALTVSTIGFRFGVKAANSATVYQVGVEGVASDGKPDGTVKNAGASKSTFTPDAGGTWTNGSLHLTTDAGMSAFTNYSCTQGEWITLVLRYNSGTINGTTDNSSFSMRWNGADSDQTFDGGFVDQTGGGSTKASSVPAIFFRSASKSYLYPLVSDTVTNWSSGTSPNERGMAFSESCNYVSTYKLGYIVWLGRTPAAGQTLRVNLYNTDTGINDCSGSSTTAQCIATTDPDVDSDIYATAGSNAYNRVYFTGTLPTLHCGTTYYALIKATSAGTAVGLDIFNFITANDLTAIPFGTAWYSATKSGASGSAAITPTTTSRPLLGLGIVDWTLPTTTAISTHPFGEHFNP